MGYTVRVDSWRFTAWLHYSNATLGGVDWDLVPFAQELYAHEPASQVGRPGTCSVDFNQCENVNVVGVTANALVVKKLFGLLRRQFEIINASIY